MAASYSGDMNSDLFHVRLAAGGGVRRPSLWQPPLSRTARLGPNIQERPSTPPVGCRRDLVDHLWCIADRRTCLHASTGAFSVTPEWPRQLHLHRSCHRLRTVAVSVTQSLEIVVGSAPTSTSLSSSLNTLPVGGTDTYTAAVDAPVAPTDSQSSRMAGRQCPNARTR